MSPDAKGASTGKNQQSAERQEPSAVEKFNAAPFWDGEWGNKLKIRDARGGIVSVVKKQLLLFLSMLMLVFSVGASEIPGVKPYTEIPVELQTDIRADKATVGESILFQTTGGVLIGRNVVVPQGAKVLATVDSIRRDPHSLGLTLVVRFREMSWEAASVDLNAVVSSVEVLNQKEVSFLRRIHKAFSQKTMLEGVNVHSHLQRNAYTEFTSSLPGFGLRKGIRLVLRQVDPNRDTEMLGKNPVLDVNRAWKN